MLRVRYVTLGVCLAAGAALAAVQTPAPPARDIANVYAETCANCHGATLTGGLAPSLLVVAREGWSAARVPTDRLAALGEVLDVLVRRDVEEARAARCRSRPSGR